MPLLDWIKEQMGKLNETLDTMDKNPWFSHAIDWLGDFLMGQHFLKKEVAADGKTTRSINHHWFRREAPHIFAESHLDENVLREILFARNDTGKWLLDAAWRVSLLDRWGPDPTVAIPDPTLGQIGRNQWNDIRLSLVSEMFTDPEECKVPLQGDLRKQKIQDICATLTEIAKLSNVYKLRRFVRMNYCKANEGDYRIVRYERFRRRTFTTIGNFLGDARRPRYSSQNPQQSSPGGTQQGQRRPSPFHCPRKNYSHTWTRQPH
jgi:hypothetical protein